MIYLGRKLGMTAAELGTRLSSAELAEQMAFDLLQDDKYKQKIQSEAMTLEERDNALRAMLGIPNG